MKHLSQLIAERKLRSEIIPTYFLREKQRRRKDRNARREMDS